MLTRQQLDHYQTFGFVVLPDFLGAQLTDALRSEVDRAIRDAYAAVYDERVIDGISGHYLPMASRHTPVSMALVCDDPRFIEAAGELLGGSVLPECPEGVLYFAEAGWHNDDGIGVMGVKFVTYFEQLTAATGALRLVPGSQHPEQSARLAGYRSRRMPLRTDAEKADYQEGFPGFAVETSPGDVIGFDLHTWHASTGGRDRLAWTITYQRFPESEDMRERTLRAMADTFEQEFRGFDRKRYPIWRDWAAGAETHPRREVVIEHLRATGVLQLEGAEEGS